VPQPDLRTTELHPLLAHHPDAAAPVLALQPRRTDREAFWSAALALVLNAEQEVRIKHGRIDVLSASYAIEVDWFDKWHEGLGQAQHYSFASGKAPAVALILKPEEWPMTAHTRSKLAEIHDVMRTYGVQVFVLYRAKPQQTALRR